MSEQEKFEAWWKEKGINSVMLRAMALTAWMARAEMDKEPQPAENPDEWVVQDRVPPRANVDVVSWSHWKKGEEVAAQGTWEHPQVHGFTDCFGHQLSVRCRRRDLPKVEQAEQWPKYYVPVNAAFSLIEQKPVAYFRRDDEESGETFHTDGTSYRFDEWTDNLVQVKQLTEAEAMALLKKPEPVVHYDPIADHAKLVNKPEPQPQKTRVRLWKWKYGTECRLADISPSGDWVEVKHDDEGFYMENQP